MASQIAPAPTNGLTAEERHVLQLYRDGRLAPRQPTSAWRLVLEALLALKSLASLAVLAVLVLLGMSLVTISGSLDQRLSGAVHQTGQAFTAAGQAVSDAFNPTHPPRYAISQDTEFSSLVIAGIGGGIGQSS